MAQSSDYEADTWTQRAGIDVYTPLKGTPQSSDYQAQVGVLASVDYAAALWRPSSEPTVPCYNPAFSNYNGGNTVYMQQLGHPASDASTTAFVAAAGMANSVDWVSDSWNGNTYVEQLGIPAAPGYTASVLDRNILRGQGNNQAFINVIIRLKLLLKNSNTVLSINVPFLVALYKYINNY